VHRKRIILASVFALGLAFAFGVVTLSVRRAVTPKIIPDETLIANFHANRQEFDALRRLVTEDARYRSNISAAALRDDNIEESQRRHTKDMLRQIDPSLTISRDYDNTVRFVFEIGGLSAIGRGWMKGIEYIPGDYHREGVILSNLDLAEKVLHGVYLRPIEGKWFLIMQIDE
jgi:hypothetical protein